MAQKDPDGQVIRFFASTGVSSPLANDNTSVTNYTKSNEFIVVIQVDEASGPWNAAYTLRWRNVTQAGSFAAIASTGEIAWGTSTALTNGAAITSQWCTNSPGGSTWQNGEQVEGAATCDAINLADEYYTEIAFAVNPAGATDGEEYAFELWDQTNSASVYQPAYTITMAASAGPLDYTYTGQISGEVTLGAGFYPLPFYDSFNRADGDLGSNWTDVGNSLSISSNECVGDTASSWNIAIFDGYSVPDNQYAQAEYRSGDTALDAFAVHVRNDGSNTADYELVWSNEGGSTYYMRLRKWISPTNTPLWQDLDYGAPTPGDYIRLEVYGDMLYAYHNTTLLTSYQDSSITTGYPALGISGNNINMDNFYCGKAVSHNLDYTHTGTISATATLASTRAILKIIPGAIAAAGYFSASRLITKVVTGAIAAEATFNSSWEYSKAPLNYIYTGAISAEFSVSHTRIIVRVIVGSVTATGTYASVRTITKVVPGAIELEATWSSTWPITKVITGSISAEATLSSARLIHKVVEGALSAEATVSHTRTVIRVIVGDISAELTWQSPWDFQGQELDYTYTGAITAELTLAYARSVTKVIDGGISAEATLAGERSVTKVIAGAIAAEGTFASAYFFQGAALNYIYTGQISAEAYFSAVRTIVKVVTGDVSAEGTLASARAIKKIVSGAISGSITANSSRVIKKVVAGAISAEATLSASRTIARVIPGDFTATATFSASRAVTKVVPGEITAEATFASEMYFSQAGQLDYTYTGQITATATFASALKLGFYDTFTRADGPIGSQYNIASGTLNISSYEVVGATTNWNNCECIAFDWPANQYAEVEYRSGSGYGGAVFVRASPGYDYELVFNPTVPELLLRRWMDPENTVLWTDPSPPTPSAGSTYGLGVYGSRLFVYYNGVLRYSHQDSNITSGDPGFAIFTTSIHLDNFYARTFDNPLLDYVHGGGITAEGELAAERAITKVVQGQVEAEGTLSFGYSYTAYGGPLDFVYSGQFGAQVVDAEFGAVTPDDTWGAIDATLAAEITLAAGMYYVSGTLVYVGAISAEATLESERLVTKIIPGAITATGTFASGYYYSYAGALYFVHQGNYGVTYQGTWGAIALDATWGAETLDAVFGAEIPPGDIHVFEITFSSSAQAGLQFVPGIYAIPGLPGMLADVGYPGMSVEAWFQYTHTGQVTCAVNIQSGYSFQHDVSFNRYTHVGAIEAEATVSSGRLVTKVIDGDISAEVTFESGYAREGSLYFHHFGDVSAEVSFESQHSFVAGNIIEGAISFEVTFKATATWSHVHVPLQYVHTGGIQGTVTLNAGRRVRRIIVGDVNYEVTVEASGVVFWGYILVDKPIVTWDGVDVGPDVWTLLNKPDATWQGV